MATTNSKTTTNATPSDAPLSPPFVVFGRHPFAAEEPDEVSFALGEPVVVLETDAGFNDGWWKGRNSRGAVGLFPRNFVTDPANPAASARAAQPSGASHTQTTAAASINSTDSPPDASAQDRQDPPAIEPHARPLADWSAQQVADWTAANGFPAAARLFSENNIAGRDISSISLAGLRELGIEPLSDRVVLMHRILFLKESFSSLSKMPQISQIHLASTASAYTATSHLHSTASISARNDTTTRHNQPYSQSNDDISLRPHDQYNPAFNDRNQHPHHHNDDHDLRNPLQKAPQSNTNGMHHGQQTDARLYHSNNGHINHREYDSDIKDDQYHFYTSDTRRTQNDHSQNSDAPYFYDNQYLWDDEERELDPSERHQHDTMTHRRADGQPIMEEAHHQHEYNDWHAGPNMYPSNPIQAAAQQSPPRDLYSVSNGMAGSTSPVQTNAGTTSSTSRRPSKIVVAFESLARRFAIGCQRQKGDQETSPTTTSSPEKEMRSPIEAMGYNVDHEGFLNVRLHGENRWRQRYCVISQGRLYVFRLKTDVHPEAVVELTFGTQVLPAEHDDTKKVFVFKIMPSKDDLAAVLGQNDAANTKNHRNLPAILFASESQIAMVTWINVFVRASQNALQSAPVTLVPIKEACMMSVHRDISPIELSELELRKLALGVPTRQSESGHVSSASVSSSLSHAGNGGDKPALSNTALKDGARSNRSSVGNSHRQSNASQTGMIITSIHGTSMPHAKYVPGGRLTPSFAGRTGGSMSAASLRSHMPTRALMPVGPHDRDTNSYSAHPYAAGVHRPASPIDSNAAMRSLNSNLSPMSSSSSSSIAPLPPSHLIVTNSTSSYTDHRSDGVSNTTGRPPTIDFDDAIQVPLQPSLLRHHNPIIRRKW